MFNPWNSKFIISSEFIKVNKFINNMVLMEAGGNITLSYELNVNLPTIGAT